ncbi:hypothetical protein MSAS_27870 [Mycobacterium saskatchewanense]|uniref:acyl-CoA dehydrogenase family protein n=1 Tax=Mycobacterium saskatchewanense TaxID=220927 RepID=UPI000A15A554|nr:acyl-CoA dehydrogenase family protein [Mycobacterium saskatchewanense]BBX63613.1 hypothetical protein MSAS_27870 [Mycobacterium saskatchewanense]
MTSSDTTVEPWTATGGLIEVATSIADLARSMAEDIDTARHLPGDLVAPMRDSGLLQAGAPREVDGLELPPGAALRCAEEVARGNASAGWCVSIAITSSLLVGYLPPAIRDDLFGGGRSVAAGVWAPRGTARPVRDGFEVTGRWPFCSGINHADILFGGVLLEDGSTSIAALPTRKLSILDTWHTLGLRGTGSHDTVADAVFVPHGHLFSLADGPVVDRPLYRFPVFGFFALCIAAAAMGNARGAISDFVELATKKKSSGSTRTLAERPAIQAAVGAVEAELEGARALYYQAIEAAWQTSQSKDPVSSEARARLRLAATHGVRTSAAIVHRLYDLAGGDAIYDRSPMQRHLRDALTATAHFQVNAASREVPGRLLLHLPTDVSML